MAQQTGDERLRDAESREQEELDSYEYRNEQEKERVRAGEHTPTPWRDQRTDTRYEILDAEGNPVLRIHGGMIPTKSSAALMLTAVNNHAQLVAVLEDELEAVRVWQSARGVPADVRDGLQISTEKIRQALSRVRE